jgi:hypothetical protein
MDQQVETVELFQDFLRRDGLPLDPQIHDQLWGQFHDQIYQG